MAETERHINQRKEDSDLSRARKRKIKRVSGEYAAGGIDNSTNRQRASRSRAARQSGPSNRERLVEDQIKDRLLSLSTIQGKVSSKLGLDPQRSKSSPAARKAHREAESHRRQALYEATPHAETQRISSSEGTYIPRKSRRVYDAHAEAPPPVMVRGGMDGMAFGRVASSRLQKQRTPRRRIDVALKTTGAEIRLPSIPLLHMGWRAISLLMVLMMSASLLLMWKAPVFQVSALEAEGLKRLTLSDLNAVMKTYGKSIFSLDPNALRESLTQAFPEFSKVSVKVNLPARVKVVVTERQPIIAWSQDGVETWVDAEGISFPPRGAPANALVQVEGYGTPPGLENYTQSGIPQGTIGEMAMPETANRPSLRLTHELVSSILALGAKMPAETMLVYDSQHGLGWNDPNGWDVFFGAEDQDMEMKLSIYQALVERLKSEGIQPALISVEYVHAPYYRMER